MTNSPQSPTIDRLIVIAAPSCCGKTVFLRHLMNGDLRHVENTLELGDLSRWVLLNANEQESLNDGVASQIIYHYALPSLALHAGSYEGFHADERLNVLRDARDVVFVTLHVESEILQARLRRRMIAWRRGLWVLLTDPATYFGERRRLKQLARLYSQPENMASIYEHWLEFSGSVEGARDLLVHAQDDYATLSVKEWRETREY